MTGHAQTEEQNIIMSIKYHNNEYTHQWDPSSYVVTGYAHAGTCRGIATLVEAEEQEQNSNDDEM